MSAEALIYSALGSPWTDSEGWAISISPFYATRVVLGGGFPKKGFGSTL